MADSQPHCRKCSKKIQTHSRVIKCHLCSNSTHITCLTQYTLIDIEYANSNNEHWSCPSCLSELFPFYDIEDSLTFNLLLPYKAYPLLPNLDDLIFNPFDLANETEEQNDLDPDSNFFYSQPIRPSRYMQVDETNKLLNSNAEKPLSPSYI